MKTIYKYILTAKGSQKIPMPMNAEILSIQNQNEQICIWAIVDPKEEKELRHFEIFGTGHPLNYKTGGEATFIGTVQMSSGSLVLHVFEKVK